MNKRSKFYDKEFSNKAIELFKKGLSSKQISEQLCISKTALIRNLNLLGYNFDRSKSMQKYTINRNYFEHIDSNDKAYWLGLIYADGCNKVDRNTFVLGLVEEDSYILEILKKDLESTVPIKIQNNNRNSNNKKFHRLELYNKKICLDLVKHGVVQNKTSVLKAPEIKNKYIYDFIRGYFDGDGSIVSYIIDKKNHYKDSISFTGTKEITDFIKFFLKKELNIHCCTYERHPDRDNNNYTISINGRLNVIKLCDKMYKNKNKRFLKRKYKKYLKIKNRYER